METLKPPGETLKRALQVAGLSPKDLIVAWGLSKQQVYNILSGKSQMSLEQADKAAKLCGITMDQLVRGESNPEREAIAEMLEQIAKHLREKK